MSEVTEAIDTGTEVMTTSFGVRLQSSVVAAGRFFVRNPALVAAVSFGVGVGVGAYASQKMSARKSEAEIEAAKESGQLSFFSENSIVGAPVQIDPTYISNVDEAPRDRLLTAKEERLDDAIRVSFDPPEFPKWVMEEDAEDAIIEQEIEDAEPIIKNIFEEKERQWEDPNWDYAEQVASRSELKPYVIHLDEYKLSEKEYDQQSVTFYAEDDVIADHNNVPVHDATRMLGEELPFGLGSGDPDVVFIRNDMFNTEYEVLRHHGSYAVEVLGYQVEEEYERMDEMRHSQRRFREE